MCTLDNILAKTKENNISQRELCRNLGIAERIFSDWKAGRTESYMKYLPQIAEFLDVSVDYLLGKEEDEELARYLEHLRTRPEMRMMFQLSKNNAHNPQTLQ